MVPSSPPRWAFTRDRGDSTVVVFAISRRHFVANRWTRRRRAWSLTLPTSITASAVRAYPDGSPRPTFDTTFSPPAMSLTPPGAFTLSTSISLLPMAAKTGCQCRGNVPAQGAQAASSRAAVNTAGVGPDQCPHRRHDSVYTLALLHVGSHIRLPRGNGCVDAPGEWRCWTVVCDWSRVCGAPGSGLLHRSVLSLVWRLWVPGFGCGHTRRPYAL